MSDKKIVESEKRCLTDQHIYCACSMLKNQFPHIGGLQSTLSQNSKLNSALTISNDIQKCNSSFISRQRKTLECNLYY